MAMGMHRPGQLIRMLTTELQLSEDQARQLRPIVFQAIKGAIRQGADLRIAELELQELLESEPVDLAQVESTLKAVEGLRTTLRLNLIKTHEQGKAVLTPEQRKKLPQLHERLPHMGFGRMGMLEPPEESGMGRMPMMPMMGPGGMGGMMGSGMGGPSQAAAQPADVPQTPTQQDTQGGVTVSATLLTPDGPRADGKLAIQLTLETHSVDLDPYQLEQLAVLRDAQGREVRALALESPSGSGHHREGVLLFPGTDASGKPVLGPEASPLTLILRQIGGVQERVFRW
jgi:Spy/CpxP family protein refolding chaperone